MQLDLEKATKVPAVRSEDVYKVGKDAPNLLLNGVDKVVNLVKMTLGPKGRPVLLAHGRQHRFTKDGVTVARETSFLNAIDNVAATVVKEVCDDTVTIVGDGTTTALVLTQMIAHLGADVCAEPGVNSVDVQAGMELAATRIVKTLKDLAINIVNKEDISFQSLVNVATVSCNGDVELGKVIANAIYEVDIHGFVKLHNSRDTHHSYTVTKGIKYDNGLRSLHYAFDENGLTTTFNDAGVLICNFDITDQTALFELVQYTIDTKQPVVLVANSITGGAENFLYENIRKNQLPIAVVNPPSFGKYREDIYRDMATMFDCIVVEGCLTGKSIPVEHMGIAGQFVAGEFETSFEGHKNIIETPKYKEYVNKLKNRMIEHADQEDYEMMAKRFAQMSHGCANIFIGGRTVADIKERKDRAEDAYLACKSALRGGILPGGGITLMHCADTYEMVNDLESESPSERGKALGEQVIVSCLSAPFNQIMANAGLNPDAIKEIIDSAKGTNGDGSVTYEIGYNVRSEKVENFLETGIVDPAEVSTTALTKATSIAGMCLVIGGILIRDSY